MGKSNEVLEKFVLQFKKLNHAVDAVLGFLGMQPCDGTGTLKAGSGKPHMLHLSGVFVRGTSVLARGQVGIPGGGRLEDRHQERRCGGQSDGGGLHTLMVADCIR